MFSEIIESCKYVVENSKHVKINQNKLKELSNQIKNIKLKHWLSSSPFGLLEFNEEDLINFLLVYESIDFSFWGTPKWTIITKDGKNLDGSIALLYAMLEYVKKNNTSDFSGVSLNEFKDMLKGNVEIPLLNERYDIITSVSKIVNDKMNGNFYRYIKNCKTDKELFKIIIDNFPCFEDSRTYHGKNIYFYKLAQLLTSDILHIREMKEHILVDYSSLVGCADYKIPQVLRGLGVLQYSEELQIVVDNKVEIFENSVYEVEIRANTLFVIDSLKRLLNNEFYSIDINDYLFLQKNNKNINLRPYHLTRNKNY